MPNTMNVAVTSVVKTGRRMQSSEIFMTLRPRLRAARIDPRPIRQQQLAIGHDGFPPFEPTLQHSFTVENSRNLHGLHRRDVVLHHKNECALLADLDGL